LDACRHGFGYQRHQDPQRRATELEGKLGEMNRNLDLVTEPLKARGKE